LHRKTSQIDAKVSFKQRYMAETSRICPFATNTFSPFSKLFQPGILYTYCKLL